MKTLAEDIEKNISDLSKVKIFNGENSLVQKPYIFLGCTHYLLIKENFKQIYKNSQFFGGYENLMTKLKNEIMTKKICREKSTKSFIKSGNLRAIKVYNMLFKNK